MRLFIAINFNEEIKSSLLNIIHELKSDSVKGNFTRKENLHLTLVFIGELPESRLHIIREAMDQVDGEKFLLSISKFGKFRNREENLYWCGIERNDMLIKIQKKLADNLSNRGISIDNKPFKPHITLGRRCVMKENFQEDQFKNKIPEMSVAADKISLMKSERINGKLVYTEIYSVNLM